MLAQWNPDLIGWSYPCTSPFSLSKTHHHSITKASKKEDKHTLTLCFCTSFDNHNQTLFFSFIICGFFDTLSSQMPCKFSLNFME
ncbi:hypothetical protein L1987_47616 [Smallanthus sonchifolius]|uniref:Uncharacterized protein n=1 Tax=Smallanthus sonchifolius TaxID=185202 RepID=A0ACB9G427_9ASTR|nr:hypothetical protein L1987_47616 [Smallanthus sonchifolius]